jgi:RimJ/RimL family protein N-acetyltransferase
MGRTLDTSCSCWCSNPETSLSRMPSGISRQISPFSTSRIITIGHTDVSIADARTSPETLVKAYLAGFAEVFQAHSALFHFADALHLRGQNARVAVLSCRGQALAGLHYRHVPDKNGETEALSFGGVWTRPEERGQGHAGRLVSACALYEAKARRSMPSGRCVIRVLPDGSQNIPSTRAFLKLGFESEGIRSAPIAGTCQDRHLSASAEPDGTYRFLEMYADPETLERRAQDVLGLAMIEHALEQAA